MSDYLDDLALPPGTAVRCKANIGAEKEFTPGVIYYTHRGGRVMDNFGRLCVPSVRFEVVG